MSLAQYNNSSNVASKASVLDDDLIGRDWAMKKFVAAVKGLAQVIDYESDMLESSGIPDYEEVNFCKTRGLRDLNKSISDIKRYMDQEMESKVDSLLADLQKKIHRNSELLQMHLEAVNDLAYAVRSSSSIKEADKISDPILVDVARSK